MASPTAPSEIPSYVKNLSMFLSLDKCLHLLILYENLHLQRSFRPAFKSALYKTYFVHNFLHEIIASLFKKVPAMLRENIQSLSERVFQRK